jgi:hypothetical protein
MPDEIVEQSEESEGKLDKVKGVIKRNWKPFAIGAGITIVTIIVTKKYVSPYVTARISTKVTTMVAKKIVLKDSVLLVQTYARHQGPPSWMIRSGDQLWRSQEAAAKAVGVSSSTMSRHLNGLRPHINGRVFERVAMEVGRKG